MTFCLRAGPRVGLIGDCLRYAALRLLNHLLSGRFVGSCGSYIGGAGFRSLPVSLIVDLLRHFSRLSTKLPFVSAKVILSLYIVRLRAASTCWMSGGQLLLSSVLTAAFASSTPEAVN